MPSIEKLFEAHPNPVRALRNEPFWDLSDSDIFKMERSNWRSEQDAWYKTVALFDLSHHMSDMYISGPDAHKLLKYLSISALDPFPVYTAKQFITASAEGYLSGDGILQRLGDDQFLFIADMASRDWVDYHIRTGNWDVTYREEFRMPHVTSSTYRFQIQGPNALTLIERALGGPMPELKFFHLADLEFQGLKFRALRHGMAGQAGIEINGPWEDKQKMHDLLHELGKDLGIVDVGWWAYASSTIESGWLCVELPGYYIGEGGAAFREVGSDFVTSLGGSFDSENLEDYMFTPYEMGYGRLVDLEHDSISRDALIKMSQEPVKRRKVTFEFNADDVAKLYADLLDSGTTPPPQFFRLIDTAYSGSQYEAVKVDGNTVGVVTTISYVSPHRKVIGIGVIDVEFAEPGTEVTVLWGDSLTIPRPNVEEHSQVLLRATIAPSPYSKYAREKYRSNA